MKQLISKAHGGTVRVPCLLFFVCVCAFLPSGCLSSVEESFQMEREIEPGTELKVRTSNGRIKVNVGRSGKILVRGKKKARALTTSKRLLEDIKIEAEKQDGFLNVEAHHPKNSFTKQYGASFEIEVPQNTPVRLVTSNGSVNVSGVTGRVWVESKNGSVKILDVTGDVEAKTKNGSIDVSGKFKKILAETSNGKISVDTSGAPAHVSPEAKQKTTHDKESNSGSAVKKQESGTSRAASGSRVVLTTKNGSVKLKGKLSSFRTRSSNGSITIRAAKGSSLIEDSKATTRNGSIKLFLPPDFSCDLSARTNNGKIKSDFTTKKSSRKRLSGTLGQGGPGLALETRNGSIHINKH